jgi:putative heme-binding domain-containing protein
VKNSFLYISACLAATVLIGPKNAAPELGLPSAGRSRPVTFGCGEDPLRLEMVRALADRADAASQELLQSAAADRSLENRVRAEAIRGLAHSASSSVETRNTLLAILRDQEDDLKREALRSLRGLFAQPDVAAALRLLSLQVDPADNLELAEQLWLAAQPDPQKILSEQFCDKARQAKFGRPDFERDLRIPQGNPESGERVFFHIRGPQCFACHRVNSRGGVAGTDLSHIAQKLHACKLHESIIDPNKEIDPQFTTWLITTHQGQVLTGIIVSEDVSGNLTLANAKGEIIHLRAADMEERQVQKTSIMPENLRDQLTWQELWDVVAFLGELQ